MVVFYILKLLLTLLIQLTMADLRVHYKVLNVSNNTKSNDTDSLNVKCGLEFTDNIYGVVEVHRDSASCVGLFSNWSAAPNDLGISDDKQYMVKTAVHDVYPVGVSINERDHAIVNQPAINPFQSDYL